MPSSSAKRNHSARTTVYRIFRSPLLSTPLSHFSFSYFTPCWLCFFAMLLSPSLEDFLFPSPLMQDCARARVFFRFVSFPFLSRSLRAVGDCCAKLGPCAPLRSFFFFLVRDEKNTRPAKLRVRVFSCKIMPHKLCASEGCAFSFEYFCRVFFNVEV